MSASVDGPVRAESGAVETWRYSLPNVKGEGWVIAFLDSTGCFTALSDWGNVAFRWNARGWGPGDFRQFLLDCDDYYLTSKLGQNRREYDSERTLACVKEQILQTRRRGKWTKDDAREEWDALKTYDDLDTEHNLTMWMQVTKLDAGEYYCERYVSDVTAFVRHAMPRLREEFRKSLNLPQPRFKVVLEGEGWRGHAVADAETLDEVKRSVRYALTTARGYFKTIMLLDRGNTLVRVPATVKAFVDAVKPFEEA